MDPSFTRGELLEFAKLYSAFFTHFTTLDIGLLVLTFTLVEKVITPEKLAKDLLSKLLLLCVVASFLLSLATSAYSIVVYPENYFILMTKGSSYKNVVAFILVYFSMAGFVTGTLLLSALAIRGMIFSRLENR